MFSIGIIDYGMSNSFSVLSMVNRLGKNAKILNSPNDIINEKKFILPGVGSFDNAIYNLKKFGWYDYLRELDYKNEYYLFGFCIGMQVLFSKSDEGSESGLDLFKGKVIKITNDLENNQLKVPAMGWKEVKLVRESKLLKDIKDKTLFYFVHSYVCIPEDKNVIIGLSNHSIDYPSIINKDNIFATQFHTEKSHKNGMKLMENYLNFNE
jgi:glutamine amidotransferase